MEELVNKEDNKQDSGNVMHDHKTSFVFASIHIFLFSPLSVEVNIANMRKKIIITVDTNVAKEMELTFTLLRQLSETIGMQKLEVNMKNVRCWRETFWRWKGKCW